MAYNDDRSYDDIVEEIVLDPEKPCVFAAFKQCMEHGYSPRAKGTDRCYTWLTVAEKNTLEPLS